MWCHQVELWYEQQWCHTDTEFNDKKHHEVTGDRRNVFWACLNVHCSVCFCRSLWQRSSTCQIRRERTNVSWRVISGLTENDACRQTSRCDLNTLHLRAVSLVSFISGIWAQHPDPHKTRELFKHLSIHSWFSGVICSLSACVWGLHMCQQRHLVWCDL